MRVGVVLFMQNFADWERFQRGDFERPAATPDHEIVEAELRLADLVEPLGFDSLWSLEHHFTPYTLTPDALQFLAWCAARTSRIALGTCVIVLPWHEPLRVAEQIAMLDIYARGREISIGFGRGAARREFDGFRVPMAESRERFAEALEIVRLALERERFSYAGRFFRIAETGIRPRPRTPDLARRMLAAAVSPESVEMMARADLGLLIIPQKSWEEHAADLATFDRVRAEQGLAPRKSKAVVFVYCAEDADEARAGGMEYIGNYEDTAFTHYELAEPGHFRAAGQYDYYAQGAEVLKKLGPRGQALARDHFAQVNVFGTPEQCLTKLAAIQRLVNADELICVFRCGGMPLEKAEASMRLFAREVLPALHAYAA